MKKISSILHTHPLAITCVLFLLTLCSISFFVHRDLDPNFKKNWWALSFENRSSETSAFIIENHSSSEEFTYTIMRDNKLISTDKIFIPKGNTKVILPEEKTEKFQENFTISVESISGEKKSIYRKKNTEKTLE